MKASIFLFEYRCMEGNKILQIVLKKLISYKLATHKKRKHIKNYHVYSIWVTSSLSMVDLFWLSVAPVDTDPTCI